MTEFDVVLIGNQQIDFYDIRNIKIHDFYKWMENEFEKPIDNPFSEVKFSELTEEENNTIDAFITDITVMEIFMKKFNYQGAVIKDNNKISGVAYVQCTCGCLASRVTSDSRKYKCSWCKRVYTLIKNHRTAK